MIDQRILESFKQSLIERFNQFKLDEISEDCIRYDFFESYRKFYNDWIVLEQKHSEAPQKKIDAVIRNKNGEIGIEFKFFANTNSSKPRTTTIANFLFDYYKLSTDKNIWEKYLILVSMETMNKYIKNNGYGDLLDKNLNEIIEIKNISSKAPHLKNIIGKSKILDSTDFPDINITKVFDCKEVVKLNNNENEELFVSIYKL